MTMPEKRVLMFALTDGDEYARGKLEESGCRVVLGKTSWDSPMPRNEEEMARMAQDCDALIGSSIRNSPITRRILQSSEGLSVVAKYTIGVDDVDVEASTELGILVTHAPTESNWGGVAEGTMALMLGVLKRLRERDAYLKDGGWSSDDLRGTYVGARADGYEGITVGIVGLGRVGGRFAELLRPWRANVIAYDPYIDAARFDSHGAKSVDFHALLRESDVVSLHVVLNRETRHMMGAAELSMMKPSAVMINTARGAVVDEKALVEALENETIAAAAIDAFEEEPLPLDSTLRKLGDRVLLSPHIVSGNVGTGLGPGIERATESVLKALAGEVPDNVFNKEVIPRWERRFAKNR